tara:strand:- start:1038 stop:1643 length:606 start_codon:yes stop_codon:yes gene_type:complete
MDPDDALYLPRTHLVHGPPSDPEKPALQTQSFTESLSVGEKELSGHSLHVEDAASEYLPDGQKSQVPSDILSTARVADEYLPALHIVQLMDPLDDLYLPLTHLVHGPPSDLEKPALHKQLFKIVLLYSVYEPVGHAKHAEDAVSEYVPASHHSQVPSDILSTAEVANENFPALQSVQLMDPLDDLYLPRTHSVHGPPFGPV